MPPGPVVVHRRAFHASHAPLAAAAGKRDFYDVLGVSKGVAEKDIKKAYYQLAKKFHPDTSSDPKAKEKFVEIQEAYDVLSDASKRSAYDSMGHAAFDPAAGGGGGGGPGGHPFGGGSPFGGAGGVSPEDLFAQMFGFGGGRGGARSGFGGGGGRSAEPSDIETELPLTFDEAVHGCQKQIPLSLTAKCTPCSGSGLRKGIKLGTCRTCRGSGQQLFYQAGFQISATCSACGGTGHAPPPPGSSCRDCGGAGTVAKTRTVLVDVPAGVDDGMKVRLSGQGDEGASGTKSDLYVKLRVRPSAIFKRKNIDIFVNVKIPLRTALLGGTVRVPTIDGDVELKVPEGTQPGDVKILRSRGVKVVNERGRGDEYVELKVDVPKYVALFFFFG
ncbi:hypothetical protein BC828DRAFT_348043 [Blastocladiella britannica]|nr:hypothetical protein BC828DRAFT_348043 [Blastocladiella britannica]